jgi:hypothetical protein
MDISLAGVLADTVVINEPMARAEEKSKSNARKKKPKISLPLGEVDKFLTHYPTAKIVIVVETHCLENGRFVWTGESPSSYEACSLLEVRSDCVTQPLADVLRRSCEIVSQRVSSSTSQTLLTLQTTTTAALL